MVPPERSRAESPSMGKLVKAAVVVPKPAGIKRTAAFPPAAGRMKFAGITKLGATPPGTDARFDVPIMQNLLAVSAGKLVEQVKVLVPDELVERIVTAPPINC